MTSNLIAYETSKDAGCISSLNAVLSHNGLKNLKIIKKPSLTHLECDSSLTGKQSQSFFKRK